ncbi:hypothetical protein GR183_05015 [Stappia sp. GBMRC 2046]|uniref:Beta-barrel assembly machine subunit BamF n=1 Tax=Stappia sediminis TaxID=2692190 RepID=A0A7X3LSG5_9HYPH|nr:hypothetical protein [Stappia sediminis]MXN64255.1 hypothetical protein [Stappia sediminis]
MSGIFNRASAVVAAALALGACALNPNETLFEALEAPVAQPATHQSSPLPAATPDPVSDPNVSTPLVQENSRSASRSAPAVTSGENLLSYEQQQATRSSLEALARSRAGTGTGTSGATSTAEILKRLGETHGDAAITEIEGRRAPAQ